MGHGDAQSRPDRSGLHRSGHLGEQHGQVRRRRLAALIGPVAQAQPGDVIERKVESVDFGRIGAQKAKQVIVQKVREAERDKQYDEYKDRIGEIINGLVKRVEYGNVIVDLGRGEGIVRRDEILGLTFTRKAAGELAERIQRRRCEQPTPRFNGGRGITAASITAGGRLAMMPADASASDDRALIFSPIIRRARSTADRLPSASARLPPVFC